MAKKTRKPSQTGTAGSKKSKATSAARLKAAFASFGKKKKK